MAIALLRNTMESTPTLRGLVVDDDPAVVGFLETLLRRRGIVSESAEDGEAAAALLRRRQYDLAFIDLLLPRSSGETLIRQFESGALKRPVSLAVISAAPNLAGVSHAGWARDVTLLSKPFSVADVGTFIDHSFTGAPREAPRRPLVFAGGGLWLEAASVVALRRGAPSIVATDVGRILELCEEESPVAVILGPPTDPHRVAGIAQQIKASRHGADIAIFVALPNRDPELTASLLSAGVDRVLSVRFGVAQLTEEILRVANLRRRVHRRVSFSAPVLLHGEGSTHRASAFDLAEGGMGVSFVDEHPAGRQLLAEFNLPDDPAPLVMPAEIAWRETTGGRLGLRFTGDEGRERLRGFVATL